MRAFIIRPFGAQQGIDFDAIEQQLIGPALERLGIEGRTTLDILRQGNIRIGMFQRLLTADLVVADLSIHNANVFYELGIRHALREKRTFLLRCEGQKYPFDLQTDRYLAYDQANPAASLDTLVAALRQTLDSEETDSPVFQVLPDLRVQDRSRFLPVPLDFREEVERAAAGQYRGDLALLAAETQGFEWESEGLRVVGRAQLHMNALDGARMTWEAVRTFDPLDLEANLLLGTIYQKLGDLTRSDLALQRALERGDVPVRDRAEVHALLGRNAKARWSADWRNARAEEQRAQALRSPHLEASYAAYAAGFLEDLNHFYSGLNALAMLTILTELASVWPDVWQERFERPAEGRRALRAHKERLQQLTSGVALSVAANQHRRQREGKRDRWAEISEADLCLLTSRRPAYVANAYRDALAGAPEFYSASVRSQLALYQHLGVLGENARAAEAALAPTAASAEVGMSPSEHPSRILLFTGHMIDAPGRAAPRFPPEKEATARQAIQEAIAEEVRLAGGVAYGVAGGASGGDILFHEVCAELGIPTHLYLVLPRELYVGASVAPAGPQWVDRFHRLYQRLSHRQLTDSQELPRWLRARPHYSIWQRNNLWMLHNALAEGGEHVTLIALWNGETGDGPGGTEDLVQQAGERGAKTIILNTKELFGM